MAWQRVNKRLFRNVSSKWDSFPYGGMQVEEGEVVSSFYFSEIPDRSSAGDLFNLFSCVGETVEVVIPSKRNKFGKRFGFVRFKGVKDEKLLAIKLDNIIIDGKKIHVNQPRFVRGSRDGGSRNFGNENQYRGGGREEIKRRFNRTVGKSLSFAEIVQGSNKSKEDKTDTTMLCFKTPTVNLDRWKKTYIGEVLYPGESYNIQTHMEMEGFFSIKVHPLGANLCVLEEMEEGIIKELLEEGIWWWKQWFKNIRPWQTNDVDSERVMWVRLHGVPCHAWCSEFFEKVANLLGNFICVDDNTSAVINLDIARIMMKVPFNFVLKEQMVVTIDGEVFHLVLREDTFGPVRILEKKLEASNGDSNSSSEYDLETIGAISEIEANDFQEEKEQQEGNKVQGADNEKGTEGVKWSGEAKVSSHGKGLDQPSFSVSREVDGVPRENNFLALESATLEIGSSFDKAIHAILELKKKEMDNQNLFHESSSANSFSRAQISRRGGTFAQGSGAVKSASGFDNYSKQRETCGNNQSGDVESVRRWP
ncbi:uncharacterized protein LOC131611050 [Vicia villosa]|uniref:uncharacterized protein LOC131611050 n=1 Tax=Vicia villosa TaxID=3911 RepID=UPI00273C4E59|nr:uncharacterized protein LOC131611050 [Vicia villosa]